MMDAEANYEKIGSNQDHWKGVWPSARFLADFLCANHQMLRNSICLELGSGTGIVGLAMAKLREVKKVVLTDYPGEEILSLLKENVEKNCLAGKCEVMGLDWQNAESTATVLESLPKLDFLIASDVFYDVCTFQPLITTIRAFFDKFPDLRFYFAYADRDDNWSIEDLLTLRSLRARLVQTREQEGASVQIGVIYRDTMVDVFCGIEGGATESHLVFVNAGGTLLGKSSTGGTNYNLDGIEKTATNIAVWIREAATANKIQLPLKALGLGLSGAEGERDNALFVEYLQKHHGDIAENICLTSDSVATVAAAFESGGVVLIAGTGSSCRVLLDDGRIFGVGGWGHMIGDGGSAFWIARNAIQLLFNEDDGMEIPHESTELLRKLLLQHFKIENKVDILEYLYNKFQKSNIASFTKTMAEHTDDPIIHKLFFDAGETLGKQFVVAAGHLPSDRRAEVDVVLVGSVFKSWSVIKEGFVYAIQGTWIPRVNLYKPPKSKALGAASLAAKKINVRIPHSDNAEFFEAINFLVP